MSNAGTRRRIQQNFRSERSTLEAWMRSNPWSEPTRSELEFKRVGANRRSARGNPQKPWSNGQVAAARPNLQEQTLDRKRSRRCGCSPLTAEMVGEMAEEE